jgi:hypothetical protein
MNGVMKRPSSKGDAADAVVVVAEGADDHLGAQRLLESSHLVRTDPAGEQVVAQPLGARRHGRVDQHGVAVVEDDLVEDGEAGRGRARILARVGGRGRVVARVRAAVGGLRVRRVVSAARDGEGQNRETAKIGYRLRNSGHTRSVSRPASPANPAPTSMCWQYECLLAPRCLVSWQRNTAVVMATDYERWTPWQSASR